MPYHCLSCPICLSNYVPICNGALVSDCPACGSFCARKALTNWAEASKHKKILKHRQDSTGDIGGCPIPWYAVCCHSLSHSETTLHSLTRSAALYQRLLVCISHRNTNSPNSMHTNEDSICKLPPRKQNVKVHHRRPQTVGGFKKCFEKQFAIATRHLQIATLPFCVGGVCFTCLLDSCCWIGAIFGYPAAAAFTSLTFSLFLGRVVEGKEKGTWQLALEPKWPGEVVFHPPPLTHQIVQHKNTLCFFLFQNNLLSQPDTCKLQRFLFALVEFASPVCWTAAVGSVPSLAIQQLQLSPRSPSPCCFARGPSISYTCEPHPPS